MGSEAHFISAGGPNRLDIAMAGGRGVTKAAFSTSGNGPVRMPAKVGVSPRRIHCCGLREGSCQQLVCNTAQHGRDTTFSKHTRSQNGFLRSYGIPGEL